MSLGPKHCRCLYLSADKQKRGKSPWSTPSKIRELQLKLYRKAKNEPGYRFYMRSIARKFWRMLTRWREPTRARWV
jgi:hypothetical protein